MEEEGRFTQASEQMVEGGGCAAGILGMLCVAFIGFLICATGLIVVGFPVMMASVVIGLMTAFSQQKVLVGECPYCKHGAKVSSGSLGFNCLACKKRFVIRGMEFWKVE
jgi:hypothetical protein